MNIQNAENPLVSIVVITYNSSRFILETLESAKAQTYQNLELIISDDGSIDNTVEICKEWLEKNKDRFIRTELIASPVNTGIPANCNRGLRAAQGEWVKFIAGDDKLVKDAIQKFIEYSKIYEKYKIFFGNAIKINEEGIILYQMSKRKKIHFCKLWKVLGENGIIAPATFFHKGTLLTLGGFSEEYFFEDYPLWIKALASKIDIIYLPFDVCHYRINESSSSVKDKEKFLFEQLKVLKKYKHKYFFIFSINLFHYRELTHNLRNYGIKYAFKRSKLIIKNFPISILVYFYPKLYYFILKSILK